MGFKGKQGGGFWNNVDGEFVGYQFETFTSTKGDDFVNFIPEIHVDGQDEPTSRKLLLGRADRYVVSEDGLTVSAPDGGNVSYGANSSAGHWFDSLVEAGEKLGIEALLPDLDAGEPLNVEALIGSRLRLGTIIDEWGTKHNGQEKGKDGVLRDRRFNVVEMVYSLPGVKTKPAAKGAAKSASRTNGSGKPGVKEDTAARDAADAIVLGLIADARKADKRNKTGETPVSKFKMAALRAHAKDANKDVIIKMLGDETYRTEAVFRGVFLYDEKAETVAEA